MLMITILTITGKDNSVLLEKQTGLRFDYKYC